MRRSALSAETHVARAAARRGDFAYKSRVFRSSGVPLLSRRHPARVGGDDSRAPIVLIASFSVQAYVSCPGSRGVPLRSSVAPPPRHRGPIGQWLVRSYRSTWGPFLRCRGFLRCCSSWARRNAGPSRGAVGAGLAAFQIVAAIFYASRDPVHGIDHSPARAGRGTQVFSRQLLCGRCGLPSRQATWTSPPPAARSGHRKLDRRLRFSCNPASASFVSWLKLCLLNLLPFVEYCVLVAGIFAIAQGRRSATEQHVALGMLSRRRRASARGTGGRSSRNA